MRHGPAESGDRFGGVRRWLAVAACVLAAAMVPRAAATPDVTGPAGKRDLAASKAALPPPAVRNPAAPRAAGHTETMAATVAWLKSALPVAREAAPAVAFGGALSLATLLACLGACALFQRRLTRQVEATLTGMEMANAEMQEAAQAARESEAALSGLASRVLGAETPMQGWAAAAMAGQEDARALARRCSELTSALPDLLPRLVAEALAASQVAGGAGLAEAAGRLERHAAEIATAANAVRHGGQAIASAAYGQADQRHAATALARQCEAAIALVPKAVVEAVAAAGMAAPMNGQAIPGAAARVPAGREPAHRINERLQDSALCLEAAAAELQCGVRASSEAQAAHTAALERAVQQAGGLIAMLPEITASLAGGTAAVRREAQRGAQSLADSAALVVRAALAVDAAASAAQAGVRRQGDGAVARIAGPPDTAGFAAHGSTDGSPGPVAPIEAALWRPACATAALARAEQGGQAAA